MKKGLLTLYLIGLAMLGAKADGFLIQNFHGVNCIVHDVQPVESFYQISRRYFVRPSTLAVVNNIKELDNFKTGSRLLVPLTETNFFTTKGVSSSKYQFKPVYYKVNTEKNINEVAAAFYSNPGNMADWNKVSAAADVDQGDRLIVGWVKYEQSLTATKAPTFIQKEKIVFGNSEERAEAKEFLKKKDKENAIAKVQGNNTTAVKRPSAEEIPFKSSKPTDNQIAEEKERVLAEKNKLSEQRRLALQQKKEKELEEQKKKNLVAKQLAEKKRLEKERKQRILAERKVEQARIKKEEEALVLKREKENAQRDEQKRLADEAKRRKNALTKKEKDFLKAEKKKEREKKKSALISKIKKITKNSYSRNKQTENKKVMPQSTLPEPIAKKEVIKTVVKKETIEKKKEIVQAKEVNQITPEVSEKDNAKKKEKSDDPLFIENKMQRLTLLKSTKGRAAFFYSGTAGAKFYAFTNLANKGGVIKVSNQGNGHYILAEVIGPLPTADRKRGYVIKLSDNSKLILGTKSKSFSAKVNY